MVILDGVTIADCAKARAISLELPGRIACTTDPVQLRTLLGFAAKREWVRQSMVDMIRDVDHWNRANPLGERLEADPDGSQAWCAMVMGFDWGALELEARS